MSKLLKLVLALVVGISLSGVVQQVCAGEISANCIIGDVMASVARMHIYCTNDLGNGVHYVASPATDSDMSNRLLMMGVSAITSGKSLTVVFDPADLSGAAYSCLNSDCRPLRRIYLSN
jgi:hypothetical protein